MSYRLFIVTQDTSCETAAITSSVIDFGSDMEAAEHAFELITESEARDKYRSQLYRNYVTRLYTLK
jgi:hypothetical protein